MAYKINEIEGVGPAYAEKLSAGGIGSTDAFLELCGEAKGRAAVVEATGVSAEQLLNWANMADLTRISLAIT
ncbi:MAG: DUF4332 domain-containing protein [Gammaproteobacteria bacterium]|nr:DUF4332 domain-containing protein [Gammaproteobacteria bacterium]